MKWKYINTDKAHWKCLVLTTLISELGGVTNIQSKEGYVLQYILLLKTQAEEP